MSSVSDLREARAVKRKKGEQRALAEVNAYFNHHPRERLIEAAASAKTIHHGVDLMNCIAKVTKLCIRWKFVVARFRYAIVEGGAAIVLVDMPDKWYVLSDDDFVYPMDEYAEKIVEMTETHRLGLWKKV